MQIKGVKGTHDLYGDESYCYDYIENIFSIVAELYNYKKIETPCLEYTEVFSRGTGTSSDVVRKEMYTFLDKGDRSVTLRPEGTAGVMRSIVENKLYATNDLPLKTYYVGPVFRYERPQLGRYRQFYQAGIEAVGIDSSELDAEVVVFAMRVLGMLGFNGLKVKVNTLGDKESRLAYKEALKAYFAPRIESMCDDCKERLKLNPLRILDCKVDADQEIAKGAPKMRDYLSKSSEERFYHTLSILNEVGIEYEIDDSLVRGLDYYGEIVFEVHMLSPTGKDYGALLGGGHYDGLLSSFDGPSDIDHGVGFALGMERIYSLMKEFDLLKDIKQELDIYLMPLGEKAMEYSFSLAEQLRSLGYSIDRPYKMAKLGSYFKKAERSRAKLALIFGDEELEKGIIQIKDLDKKEQKEVSLDNLDKELDELFNEEDHHHE
ncbi:MAG: histidine--tRNA ligase [Candidatus Enteromonas sp.]|nr:histidine--tRNA ligase [Candidatus Enteromonas sp.]